MLELAALVMPRAEPVVTQQTFMSRLKSAFGAP
jgi:hypothetical protein